MFVVTDMRTGSCVGSLFENLMGSVGNSVDETEQGISVKMMVLVSLDQTDSKKSLDGSSTPDCMFWSMDCN